MIFFSKRLPKEQHRILGELQRMENYFRQAAYEVKANTVRVPKGKTFAAQLEATATLIGERKFVMMSETLARMGLGRASVNLDTGHIKPLPNEPRDTSEAA